MSDWMDYAISENKLNERRPDTLPCPGCGLTLTFNDNVCNDQDCECRNTPMEWLHPNGEIECTKDYPLEEMSK